MKSEQDLVRARSLIRDTQNEIDFQRRIIEALRASGQPTQAADRFMLRLRDTLQARREHRRAVAHRINGQRPEDHV